MTHSIDGYYLCAYCINAISLDHAEVEWIILSQDLNGDWINRNGDRYNPFFTQPITIPHPPIPDGWIEHLHNEAIRFAVTHKAPAIDLASALGIRPAAPPKIDRRI